MKSYELDPGATGCTDSLTVSSGTAQVRSRSAAAARTEPAPGVGVCFCAHAGGEARFIAAAVAARRINISIHHKKTTGPQALVGPRDM